MDCPNCSNPMQEVTKYDVEIDYCPRCKGVFLDRGEIDKIANTQIRYDEEHYQRYHNRDRDYDDYDDDYYHYRGHKRRRGFFGDPFDFD